MGIDYWFLKFQPYFDEIRFEITNTFAKVLTISTLGQHLTFDVGVDGINTIVLKFLTLGLEPLVNIILFPRKYNHVWRTTIPLLLLCPSFLPLTNHLL